MVLTVGALGCGSAPSSGSRSGRQLSGPPDPELTLRVPFVDKSRCLARGKRVEVVDFNRDRRPDVWRLFAPPARNASAPPVMTCKQIDYDGDGVKDYRAFYDDGGALLAEDFVFTSKGTLESRTHYDRRSGRVSMVELDSDQDLKTDTWETYDSAENLKAVQRDRNGDGRPDLVEQYRDGDVVLVLYDEDFDSHIDRREPQERTAPTAK